MRQGIYSLAGVESKSISFEKMRTQMDADERRLNYCDLLLWMIVCNICKVEFSEISDFRHKRPELS